LGYTKHRQAVLDFTQRNEHFQRLAAICSIDLENCDERVLYV
jgi:hypothetical protein